MQFRRSAGIYVVGICFVIGGPLLALIGSIYGTRTAIMGLGGDTSNGDTAVLFIALIFVGAALFIVGLFILIAAVHRALVKIDALHVGAASGNRDSWSAARR